MNVGEINPGTTGTISQYLALTLPLTIVTAWIIIAFQSKYIFPSGTSFIKRLAWPIFLIQTKVFNKSIPHDRIEKPEYRDPLEGGF